MTVYVDDYRVWAQVGRGRSARWSHLIADTREELHAFADRLGLRRAWFQDPVISGKPMPARPGSHHAEMWHYDVTDTKRQQAIRLGAVAVTSRELTHITRRRWQDQQDGGPSGPPFTQRHDHQHDQGRDEGHDQDDGERAGQGA